MMHDIKSFSIAGVFLLCMCLFQPSATPGAPVSGAPSAGEVVYPSEWIIVDDKLVQGPSSWTFLNDTLIQSSNAFGGLDSLDDPRKPGTYAVSGDPDWIHYILSADILSRDDDSIGLLFRYQDENNHYRFSMDRERGYRRLAKITDGATTVLAEDHVPYEMNRWYSVRIEVRGSLMHVYVDDEQIFRFRDGSLDKGRIGLYSWANAGSEFKNIRVTPLELADASVRVAGNTPKPYTIQAGVFSVRANADRRLALLQSRGYSPYVVTTTNRAGDRVLYNIRLEDFASLEEASRFLDLFKKREDIPAVITALPSPDEGVSDRELAMIDGYGQHGVDLITVDSQQRLRSPETASAASAVAVHPDQYAVQIGAYSFKQYADKMYVRLRTKGYDPYYSLVTDMRSEDWFTVRLGNYDSVEEARLEVLRFENTENLSAVVTSVHTLDTVSEKYLASLDGYGATGPDAADARSERTPQSGLFAVQVGAFLSKSNADDVVRQLRAKGYEPYIFQISDIRKPDWHIVRLGDFDRLTMAMDAVNQLARLKSLPAVITFSDSLKPVPKVDLAMLDGHGAPGFDVAAIGGERERQGDLEYERTGDDSRKPYSVQVGAFLDRQNAEMLMATLKDLRYTPYIYQPPTDKEPQTWYTVRIGDFDDVEKASVAAALIHQDENLPTSITHVNSLSTVPMVLAELVDINRVNRDRLPPIHQPADVGSRPFFGEEMDESVLLRSAALRQIEEQLLALQEEILLLREEAQVRKKLELTEQEKMEEEEEILTAIGRDYSMSRKGTVGLTYDLGYSYVSFDALINQSNVRQIVEHQGKHHVVNALSVLYALRDNLSVSGGIPFVYKYDNMGTDEALTINDIGDMTLGIQWQPIKSGLAMPTMILSSSLSFPTGRSPYKINPDSDLATGAGIYSISAGASMSKAIDPVIVFGSLIYTLGMEEDGLNYHRFGGVLKRVVPGHNIGSGVGMGFALSYRVSINMSFSYSYGWGYEQYWKGEEEDIARKFEDAVSASFTFGVGFRMSPTRSINVRVGTGLTNDAHDFTTSVSIPFDF